MAESWTIAFGRYLRTLRDRRGLSLDQVEGLSEAFPDPIRKAYRSRCENGHQSPAFSKVVALCRIYEVPAEVQTKAREGYCLCEAAQPKKSPKGNKPRSKGVRNTPHK